MLEAGLVVRLLVRIQPAPVSTFINRERIMRRIVTVTVKVAIDSDQVNDGDIVRVVDSAVQAGLASRDTDVGGSYFDHADCFVADEFLDYKVTQ